MKRIILLIAFVALHGCLTTDLTDAERDDKQFVRDYNRAIDLENWRLCQRLYDSWRTPAVHIDHLHGPRDRIRPWMIKQDLARHNCKYLLDELWSEGLSPEENEENGIRQKNK